jgi:hypothetical protein
MALSISRSLDLSISRSLDHDHYLDILENVFDSLIGDFCPTERDAFAKAAGAYMKDKLSRARWAKFQ